MKTIAVVNQKGGVGKTACAYNLAYNFSQKKIKTCLIDLDPSANATKGLNFPSNCCNYSGHLLLDKHIHPNETLYPHDDFLSMIPSRIQLALAQRELANKSFREKILFDQLKRIMKHDYFFIDCSPTLSDLTINAIYAANFILIPITYEDDALEGLNDLFKVIKEIKEDHIYTFKILRNQKDSRKTLTNEYIEKKLRSFDDLNHVFKTIVRQDEKINQAKIERKPVQLYAPYSNGTQDFNLLTEELLTCLQN